MSDKIAEIRARHSKRSEIDQSGCYRLDGFTYMGSLAQSQEDVATLLSEVERLRVLNTLLERNDERRVDEVEWLRAENERVWRRYDIKAQILDDRATLLAEVERLRADLATQQGCCDEAAAQDAHIRQEREEHRAEIERLQHQNRLFRKALSFVASYRSLHPDSRNLVASHMSSVANEALEGKP